MNVPGFRVTAEDGGVVIQSSVESRPMSIGGSDNAVAGINLTDAELANITTSSSGSITFGDAAQTGDITVCDRHGAGHDARPASTVALQSPAGPGKIVFDQQGVGRGLNPNGGSVLLTPGYGYFQVIDPAIVGLCRGRQRSTAASNQTAGEGASTDIALGSFVDEGTNDNPWTVTVNWGDNTPNSTFSAAAGAIDQHHVFASGTYTVSETVTNGYGLTSNTVTFQVSVSDPPVTISGPVPGFLAAAGVATGLEEVGEFTDPGNPTGLVLPVSDYSVTVNWGDGSAHSILSSAANIAYLGQDGHGNGLFSVLAGHTFLTVGVFPINWPVRHGRKQHDRRADADHDGDGNQPWRSTR